MPETTTASAARPQWHPSRDRPVDRPERQPRTGRPTDARTSHGTDTNRPATPASRRNAINRLEPHASTTSDPGNPLVPQRVWAHHPQSAKGGQPTKAGRATTPETQFDSRTVAEMRVPEYRSSGIPDRRVGGATCVETRRSCAPHTKRVCRYAPLARCPTGDTTYEYLRPGRTVLLHECHGTPTPAEAALPPVAVEHRRVTGRTDLPIGPLGSGRDRANFTSWQLM